MKSIRLSSFFRQNSLKFKFSLLLASIWLVLGIFIYLIFSTSQSISHKTSYTEGKALPDYFHALRLLRTYDEIVGLLEDAIFQSKQAFLVKAITKREEFEKELSKKFYELNEKDFNRDEILDSFKKYFNLATYQAQILLEMDTGGVEIYVDDDFTENSVKVLQLEKNLQTILLKLIKSKEEILNTSIHETSEKVRNLYENALHFGSFVFFISLGGLLLIVRQILRPIIYLGEVTGFISRGDFSHQIDLKSLKDIEFTDLGKRFNHMLDVLEVSRQNLEKQKSELKRSNEDLEQFAYIASHDLKAPLRAMDHLTDFLREDLNPHLQDESQKHFSMLKGRIRRMERLLDDLLQYSRLTTIKSKYETVVLKDLVENIVLLTGNPDHIKIHQKVPSIKIKLARIPFELVLRNLLSNAIKHHDKMTGNVWIEVSEFSTHIIMKVRDDGPGIDMQYKNKVFGLFQTLKSKDEFESSGMGLAIVKRVIELHEGNISLAPNDPSGVSFTTKWNLIK